MSNLKLLRVERGLTLMQVAKKLGYKYPGSYAKIENGVQELRADQVIKLSELFEVSEKKILNKSYSS